MAAGLLLALIDWAGAEGALWEDVGDGPTCYLLRCWALHWHWAACMHLRQYIKPLGT